MLSLLFPGGRGGGAGHAGGGHLDLLAVLQAGVRVTQHHVEARVNDVWMTIATGTAIGQRKVYRMSPVTADRVALVITETRGAPAISELGVYDTTHAGDAGSSP